MKLNLPNLITLSRIPMMFVIVWLMCSKWGGAATTAFILFLAASIGDWLDGYLARKQQIVTNFGKFMDALTDKILIVGIMVTFVALEEYSKPLFLVMVLLTLCREFLVSGMRMVAASKGIVVAAERGGKIKTIVQCVAVSFLLFTRMLLEDWNGGGEYNVTDYADILHWIGLGLFVTATALTVSSGVNYTLKYRKVFEESGL